MQIQDSTIVVTGATSGIGRALAEALHDRGNRVIVTGRRQTLLDEIAKERPGIVPLALDPAATDGPVRLAAEVADRFSDLHTLIANAGISRSEDPTDWAIADAEAIVGTNILGTLRTIGALLPLLQARPKAAILATSSNLAFVPRADFPTYCASKAFLNSFLQSLRHQMRCGPVEVLELAPPYVQNPLTGNAQVTDPRAMALSDYIAEVLDLLGRSYHPNGEVLVARDRAHRFAEREGRYAEVFAAMNPN